MEVNKNEGTIKINGGSTAMDCTTMTNISTSTYTMDPWNTPERVEVIENADNIEMIYHQFSKIQHANMFGTMPADKRIFKIIYSCVDGKWNKSEPIYGKIIPAQKECYEFED